MENIPTIWHCSTDSTEGNTYDVHIISDDRPTDEQIRNAMHLVYMGEFSEYIKEDLAELELYAVRINDDLITIEGL